MQIKKLRGASALALLMGTSGFASAFAQQASDQPQTAPQTVDQVAPPADAGGGEKVVVTGSLIATTPEDAPKPVEVYTLDDLAGQGSPSTSDFIRSLSVTSGDDLGFGQATAEVPTGSGFTNANLRGLGSSATLVLVNGRRTAAANGGFGADINMVPMEALGSVEVLKDGASATYGAGALGGVINFKTRRDIDAPQITLEKRFYDGSDGAYEAQFLTGWVGDAGNVLLSLQYEHEDPMLASELSWNSKSFDENPSIYRLFPQNPGRFHTSTNFLTGAPVSVGAPLAGAVGVGTTTIRDQSSDADCTALGGIIINQAQQGNATALNGCGFNRNDFTDAVQEHNGMRLYSEFNTDISETMEAHFDVSWGKNENFFRQIPLAPTTGVPAGRSTDASVSPFCTSSCYYVTPVQVNVYNAAGQATPTVVRNPFIDDFYMRTGVSAVALPTTGALYNSIFWGPGGFGGTPLDESGLRRERYHREQLIINAGLNGVLSEEGIFGFMAGVKYDWNGQYSQYKQENQNPDISIARLQSALLGYGGPNCNAQDRVATDYTSAASFNRTVGIQSDTAPGSAGCQWFNPFASSFATSVANGAANPQFNAGTPILAAGSTPRPTGYANSRELWDWLWIDKTTEDIYESSTFEGTLSGEVPDTWFSLPGGEIGWAVGSQWRQIERRSFAARDTNPAEEALLTQECPYPDPAVVNTPAQPNQDVGQRGCATATGAFFGSGRANITTRNVPAYSDSQNIAIYTEVALPVLDNLNFNISARHEEFNGGDLTGDIWSVAGKWDITDSIYARGSYSTNYRAEAALDIDPGTINFGNSSQARFANQVVPTATLAQPGLQPEDDSTINVGVGYVNDDLFGGRLRASLDFFEINITGQVVSTSITTILTNVFGANTAPCQADRSSTAACGVTVETATGLPPSVNNNAGQFANCNARLISFLAFTGACTQGVTTAAQILGVNLYQVNGPYFVTNGLDYKIDYSHDLFGGVGSVGLEATQTLHYKQGAFDVNGVLFDGGGDRLGTTNLGNGGLASVSQEWKGNVTLRWANDMHNVTLRGNYASGSRDERYALGQLTAIQTTPTTQYSLYGVEADPSLTYDLTYIYTAPFFEELELRASIINLTDEDPTFLQVASGYYNGSADPRGRILEIGLTKKF
ncbi:MAG: TonB-dependent receptor plug domain-containing protein [Hyphomonadaceae bacterium]|nr:TonB-dependent receptor plug domain-containing protein [Hyphomonadaceae bacterium]